MKPNVLTICKFDDQVLILFVTIGFGDVLSHQTLG